MIWGNAWGRGKRWGTGLVGVAFVGWGKGRLPPKTGQADPAANVMPGRFTTMPYSALPLTLSAVSRRLAEVPTSLKSLGSLSATFSGTGNVAAVATSSP